MKYFIYIFKKCLKNSLLFLENKLHILKKKFSAISQPILHRVTASSQNHWWPKPCKTKSVHPGDNRDTDSLMTIIVFFRLRILLNLLDSWKMAHRKFYPNTILD